MIGSVSAGRHEQIVAKLREAVETLSKSQFLIGDGALEVVPMADPHSGRAFRDDLFGVSAWLPARTRSSRRSPIPRGHWAAIKDPPLDKRTGRRRWTRKTTRQRVGYHGPGPETVQEKVEAVHDLVRRRAGRHQVAEFRRFLTGTVAPHAAAHPGDKWVKHIIAQLNSIESTLDLVISA